MSESRRIHLKPLLLKLSPKLHWKEILGVLMLLLAFVFFRSERKELAAIVPQLKSAHPLWIVAGVFIAGLMTFFQGGMYRKTFSAVGLNLPWFSSLALFLKRNFLSVFLPAGGVSALAYLPPQIRRFGFKNSDVHQASGLYAFAGLLTVFLAGLPVVIYTIISTSKFKNSWLGLVAIILVIVFLWWLLRSIRTKGRIYTWTNKRFPSATPVIEQLTSATVNMKTFSRAVGFSLGVELSGMLTVYISMFAIGAHASFGAAASAYIIAVLMMVVSPFMRGLGAVEMSMTYVLTQFGYSSGEALSITILYRVFEFWLPLVAGFVSFTWRGRHFVLRALPVVLIFSLGIINIISALTPPIHLRFRLLREYLPLNAIHASNALVLFSGIALLVTSVYLIRGLRNAFIVAVVITVLSLIGNITKALDYEEALFCFITLLVLLGSARQYRLQGSREKLKEGIANVAIVFLGVLVFGFVSFYFLNPRHFQIDFSWKQALLHTLKSFLLVEDTTIQPVTRFGREYILVLKGLGLFTWIYLLRVILRTKGIKATAEMVDAERAGAITEKFGKSALDYFKLNDDKQFFFSALSESFISYKRARNIAVVLEGPVGPDESAGNTIKEFQSFCYESGLLPVYYRVPEYLLPIFDTMKKKKVNIGQEAILDAEHFTLEGKEKKSLRNGIKGLEKNGFHTEVRRGPHSDDFIFELNKISDEWLREFDKEESVFSQGMFDKNELKNQDVIVLLNGAGETIAFLNIIPDYAPGECTYDLIRKTKEAPGAAMDALIIELVSYAKSAGNLFINMGLVPFTGLPESGNAAEQVMKVAVDRLKRFQHYKGLRQFKEKYATIWENKYLIYDNDFDLLQLPSVLAKVMKPMPDTDSDDDSKI